MKNLKNLISHLYGRAKKLNYDINMMPEIYQDFQIKEEFEKIWSELVIKI